MEPTPAVLLMRSDLTPAIAGMLGNQGEALFRSKRCFCYPLSEDATYIPAVTRGVPVAE